MQSTRSLKGNERERLKALMKLWPILIYISKNWPWKGFLLKVLNSHHTQNKSGRHRTGNIVFFFFPSQETRSYFCYRRLLKRFAGSWFIPSQGKKKEDRQWTSEQSTKKRRESWNNRHGCFCNNFSHDAIYRTSCRYWTYALQTCY